MNKDLFCDNPEKKKPRLRLVVMFMLSSFSFAFSQTIFTIDSIDTASYSISEESKEHKFQDRRVLWETKISIKNRNTPAVFHSTNGILYIIGHEYENDKTKVFFSKIDERSGKILTAKSLLHKLTKHSDGKDYGVVSEAEKFTIGNPVRLTGTKDNSLLFASEFYNSGIVSKLDRKGNELWRYEHLNEHPYLSQITEMADGSFRFFSISEKNEIFFNRISATGKIVDRKSVFISTKFLWRECLYDDGIKMILAGCFLPAYENPDRKKFVGVFETSHKADSTVIKNYFNDSIQFFNKGDLKRSEFLTNNAFRITDTSYPAKIREMVFDTKARLLKEEIIETKNDSEYISIVERHDQNLGYGIKKDPHYEFHKKDIIYNVKDGFILMVGFGKNYGIFDRTVIIKLKVK